MTSNKASAKSEVTLSKSNTMRASHDRPSSCYSYLQALLQLARQVAKALALSLSLEEGFFADRMCDPPAQVCACVYGWVGVYVCVCVCMCVYTMCVCVCA